LRIMQREIFFPYLLACQEVPKFPHQEKPNIMKHFQRALFAFIPFLLVLSNSFAYQVTSLSATYQNGQVFLTWTNPSATNLKYNVYRSSSAITAQSQLNSSTYLGYVMDNSGKNIRKSNLKGSNIYFTINPSAGSLASNQGLYVVTCTNNQIWYYAVTVTDMSTNVENKSIVSGSNTLSTGVQEAVADVQPILQNTVIDNSGDVDYEYVVWGNNQTTTSLPAFNNCGSYGYNFTYISHTTGNVPLYIFFRDTDPFTHFASPAQCGNCNSLVMDDWLPNGTSTYWFGYNDGYNIYSTTNNVAFTTGTVRSYTHARVKWTINWIVANKQVDGTRIYCSGTSHNGFGAILTGMIDPGMIAAEWGTVPPPIVKALNGSSWEKVWCANTADLPTDVNDPNTGLPIPIWTLFDFRAMFRINNDRGIPYIGGVNGKKDVTIGWVQTYNWYDSVNISLQGGIWFWDQRNHNGLGKNFADTEATINYSRFSTTKSYPAFSYCTINQNPGNSDPNSGDPYGALNGYLDWDDNSISDQPCSYSIKCNVKDMYVGGVLQTQYDTCTADITLRRIQNFHPEEGQTLSWTNYAANNTLIQSGSFVYNGGPVTLYGVKIKRSGSTITVQSSSAQMSTFYADADGDGYGNLSSTIQSCAAPSGYVTNSTDCNDTNSSVHPGAIEICNGIDDNCDGQIDEGVKSTFYQDADGDGYGNSSVTTIACSAPNGFVADYSDCDDTNPNIHPNAVEIVNGIDDNCNGQIDEANLFIFYADADGDGYGNINATVQAATAPSGYVSNSTDCNDGNSSVHPGATEICNGIDDNCDGQVDEGVKTTYYADADGDGYGNVVFSTLACSAPSGYVSNNTDCNDASASVHPGASEVCNEVDDNCNGQIDEGVVSAVVTPSGDVSICSGSNITLQANTGSGLTYQWKKNGMNVSGATTSNYTVSQAATYTVVVTHLSCSATSSGINLNLIQLNAPTVSSSTGAAIFCSNSGVYLTTAATGYYYAWYKGSVAQTGATNQNYTPTSSGNYKVKITDTNGCTAFSNIFGTTVNTAPAPAINGSSTICEGQSTSLSASNTSYASYLWSTGATAAAILVSSAGSYTLKVTDGNACTGTSDPKVMTVNSVTTPSITAGGPTEFCGGGSVILSVTQAYNSYLWSNNKLTQSQTVNSSGTYYCTVTDANGCTANSNSISVNVHTLPTPSINTSSGTTTFCSNSGVYLTTLTTGYSYAWFKASSQLAGATSQTYTPSSSGSYKLQINDALGCTASSSSISITVNTAPSPTITGSTSICQGHSTTLIANSTYSHYSWSNGATTQSITTSSASTYGLTVTDANGCTGTASPVTTLVYSNPVATITTSGSTDFCDGSNVTLTASNASSYSWSNGKSTQAITVSVSGTFTVTITDSHGCTASASVAANDHVVPAPAISAVGPTTYCIGNSGSYLTTSTTGYSYQWKKGTVAVSGATTQNYQPASSGTYKIQISDNIGCTKLSTTGIKVTANPVPTVSISAGGNLNLCNGATVVLSASATGTGIKYQWQKNASNISGATTSSYTASQAGNYSCLVTNSKSCTANSNNIVCTANCKLQNGDQANNIESPSIVLYPNPAFNTIHIEAHFTSEPNGDVLLEIRDILGKLVYYDRPELIEGSFTENLSLDQRFSGGTYFARICSSDECISKTFIISGTGR